MAIAFPVTGSTGVANPGTTATSGSFTPSNNSVIFVFVGCASVRAFTLSNSGTALTWTKQVDLTSVAGGTLNIFSAPVTSHASMTVTATSSGSDRFFVKPVCATGVDLTTPVGDTGTDDVTLANPYTGDLYVSTVDNSRGIGLAVDAGDFSSAGSPTSSDGIFTALSHATNGISAIAVAKAATPTSGTTVSFNCSASGSGVYSFAALEVLPDAPAQSVSPAGIASGEAVGTAKLNLQVSPSGIASGQAVGTAQLNLKVSPSGIATGQAFGTANVGAISPAGISLGEALGSPVITYQQFVSPSGIPSGEAVGALEDVFTGHPQDVSPTGISPGESIVAPSVRLAKKLMLTTPSIQETPAGEGWLYRRFGIHRGISIVKTGPGSFYETRYPAQTLIEQVEKVYLGGHIHTITVAEAQELTAAGYGSYITLEDND